STNVKGYKKNLELMIVVKNNKIINIVKTASGETIAKPLSAENFSKYYDIDLTKTKGFHTNKQTADKDKTGVTVISGATLSSNGICNSIDLVVAYHNQIVGGKA
ncbi:MAG: FMN-binding protein, partial [Clostridia bacterium]